MDFGDSPPPPGVSGCHRPQSTPRIFFMFLQGRLGPPTAPQNVPPLPDIGVSPPRDERETAPVPV